MKRLLKFSILPLLFAGFALALLFSSWLYTYNRLTHEELIAELDFERIGADRYRASVATGDLCRVELYQLDGDQWRIDAEFVKWKPWANLFGLNAMYRLDRIEGRYRDIRRQNAEHPIAYELPRDTAFDLVGLADSLGRFNFLLDASYGSSTYHDIDTTMLYRVYKTQSGLITRASPRPPLTESDQALVVTIDRACGGEPSLWTAAARWLDDRL
ncbi:MAG: hypothetical protein LBV36_05435 [Chromatiales bacterium]|jgi:hypothetical protein|nr:hypothetical protein [Chromatiales bacterium]